jgi:virginiamycin A acetyltransferase
MCARRNSSWTSRRRCADNGVSGPVHHRFTMHPRLALKRSVQFACLALAFPAALASGFGRWRAMCAILAHSYALLPGIAGSYLRVAFYRMTLRSCSADVHIGFGTVFVHSQASVGPHVSIGMYCVIGRASIGARTQVASLVQFPSGRRQHGRDEQGRILGAESAGLQETVVGADCWIGASAVVMANVGDGTTVGAGAIVVDELPPGVLAVGNPARVVRGKTAQPEGSA